MSSSERSERVRGRQFWIMNVEFWVKIFNLSLTEITEKIWSKKSNLTGIKGIMGIKTTKTWILVYPQNIVSRRVLTQNSSGPQFGPKLKTALSLTRSLRSLELTERTFESFVFNHEWTMIYTNEVKTRKLYVFLCDLCERQIQGFNSKSIIHNSKLPCLSPAHYVR